MTRGNNNSRDMDPEYYFRPRVAALASAQLEYAGTPVGSARGSLARYMRTITILFWSNIKQNNKKSCFF